MTESDNALVTIAQFISPIDAELARAKLDAFGIMAILLDENIGNIQLPYAGVTGGVRLQVLEGQEAQAIEILNAPPEPAGSAESDDSADV